MKKIDLTGKFKGLDGKVFKTQNGMGEMVALPDINLYIADILYKSKTDDPGRNKSLCLKMFADKRPQFENHDIDFIKKNLEDIFKTTKLMDLITCEINSRFK